MVVSVNTREILILAFQSDNHIIEKNTRWILRGKIADWDIVSDELSEKPTVFPK
jgi:hypothetical protein